MYLAFFFGVLLLFFSAFAVCMCTFNTFVFFNAKYGSDLDARKFQTKQKNALCFRETNAFEKKELLNEIRCNAISTFLIFTLFKRKKKIILTDFIEFFFCFEQTNNYDLN